MQPNATPSVEISIALLSWINDQLRESVEHRQPSRLRLTTDWLQNTVTVLATMLFGLCLMVLQRWS